MFHLRYVGDGEHYVIGYPAVPGRIEEVDDLDEALRLAQTDLYEIIEEGEVPDLPVESEK